MKSIQAIFWDYDNTLLATAESHWNKHLSVLKRKGIFLDEKHRKRIYENNGNQNWQWMNQELGLETPQNEYLEEIDAEFQKHLLALEMRPGVATVLDFVHQMNIPQAIVTNSRTDSAKPILTKKGILQRMNLALFKEDYEGRKPQPEPYLAALKKMSDFLKHPIDSRRCLAVEDDPKGVESAHRAGLIVIHRKLCETDPDCIYANYSCFHESDFVNLMKKLIQG